MSIWLVKPIFNSEEQGEIQMKLPCSYKSALRVAKEKTGADEVVIKPLGFDEPQFYYEYDRDFEANLSLTYTRLMIQCCSPNKCEVGFKFTEPSHRSYAKRYLLPLFRKLMKYELSLVNMSEKEYFSLDHYQRYLVEEKIWGIKNARQKTSE